MFDLFIETSPLLPADDEGFVKGILHSDRSCEHIKGPLFSTFNEGEGHPFYSLKVGRGAWIRVKSHVRCDCYREVP